MPRYLASTIELGSLLCLAIAIALGPRAASAQVAMSPQMRSEAMGLMKACRPDYDRLCKGVQPGGGRILACLQSHATALSSPCAQSMGQALALKDKATAAGALPK